MLDGTTVSGVEVERGSDGLVKITVGTLTGSAAATADQPGWSGVIAEEGENTVAVYTDIEAPDRRLIALDLTNGSRTIDSAVERARVRPASGPPERGSVLSYPADAEFKGTYRGVPGTFTCRHHVLAHARSPKADERLHSRCY